MSDTVKTPPSRPCFAPTAWTVIGSARVGSPDQASAWEHLYKMYAQPVSAFLRWRGQSNSEAEETSQRFFTWLWEKDVVARAERTRGKFRNFLLTSLKQFVERERRHSQAAKRKPSIAPSATGPVRVDQSAEFVDPQAMSPERAFDRACALELLQRALERLRLEYEAAGQGRRFSLLAGFLTGIAETSCDAAALELDISPAAVHVAAHRLRRRYGQLLREEILNTVPDQDDIDEEIHALFRVLRRQ